MAEGGIPPLNVPTTPTPLTGPQEPWEQFFGDEAEQIYMVNDIRERHVAAINQDGKEYLWLKRKTSGTECPYWDQNTQSCRDPLNAKAACYNTRYIGGFEQPLMIKVGLPTATRTVVSQDAGLLQTQPMKAWTLWTPTMTNRDMLVARLTGERFEVLNVTESGPWRGMIIAQFFDLRVLQISVDFGYNVTIPKIS